jgi:hypothetical protein
MTPLPGGRARKLNDSEGLHGCGFIAGALPSSLKGALTRVVHNFCVQAVIPMTKTGENPDIGSVVSPRSSAIGTGNGT